MTSDNQRTPSLIESTLIVNSLKIIIVAVFVYPVVYYTIISRGDDVQEEIYILHPEDNATTNVTEITKHKIVLKKKMIKQPQCPKSYLYQVILKELCQDLLTKRLLCTPGDIHNLEKHKIPKIAKNNTSGEPRGTIVGCIAAGLLLTSLAAAFVELYKAKSQTPAKSKPALNRKCSLADLTVLKHNRKELVRRESIMEMAETSAAANKTGKPFRPPPLNRRSSFPVGPLPLETNYGYNINTNYGNMNIGMESRRTSIVESRRLSIIDSRRSSVVSVDTSKKSISIEAPRLSISVDNESPERRHYSRLVHRH